MKQLYKIFILLIVLLFCGFSYAVTTNNFLYENRAVLPTATISANRTLSCLGGQSPIVTLVGLGGTAPYTFEYTINGTLQPTLTTTNGNSIGINVPTDNLGNFTYQLVSVSDSSGTQLQNMSVSINIINPIVDFTTDSDANTCSGDVVQFSSQILNGTAPYTYQWSFGDGTISNLENPTHTFISLGCGTGTFVVSLTIVDANGCSVTQTHDVVVKQQPDIAFVDQINPFDPFSNCFNASSSSPNYQITVGNASSSTACITSYSIDWGDGTSEANVNFPLSHTYTQLGAYNMVITAEGTNGCNVSRLYVVKNVTNPSGGLTSPGNTQNLCAPTPDLQFTISNWALNSGETTYQLNYGDGTPAVVLSQSQLVASPFYNAGNPSLSLNYPVPHSYAISNCPATQFVASLTVSNACGSTTFTVDNIIILAEAQPDFIAPPIACEDTSVLFDNTTSVGFGPNCNQNAMYSWNFGDGTPIVTTTPSMPADINHTFTQPGTYVVSLIATNFCGASDPVTRTICIESPLNAQFSLNDNEGCIPFAVTATDTTDLTNACEAPTYLWTVTYANGNCGTTADYSFTNGTTSASANPSFSFTSAGTYTLTLTVTNSCGSSTTSQVINVKQPPTATINPLADVCGPLTINPTAVITSCATASEVLTYAWSFPGGLPATANTAIPGAIVYDTPGDYTVSLIVSNECGVSVTATESFTIKVVPVITNTDLAQTICSGSQTTTVVLTSDSPGTTFTWTASATAGVSGFTASGITPSIPVQTIITTNTVPGTVTYTITPTLDGCVGDPVDYVITVNPAPIFTSQPISSTICEGGTPTQLSVTIANATGTPAYQWYSNTVNNTTSGVAIPGAESATYSPSSAVVGILYYYVVVTLPSGGCSSIISNTAQVTIIESPSITTQPTPSQSLCIGGSLTSALSIAYTGGTGTVGIQWYSNTVNNTTSGTIIPGATNANYTPPVFNTAGTFYFYAEVTFSGNGCGTITSDVAEVIIVNDPTITTQPLVSQTLCQGAVPTDLTVVATGGIGTYFYQWYSNTVNNTTSGTLITGATNDTFTPPTVTVGTMYYYVQISQAGIGCNVTSATAEVIINPAPTITTQPVSSSICEGGTPTTLSVAYANGVGTPTYQWYSNTANTTVGAALIPGETNPTYLPPSTTAGITYYFAIITFGSGGGCSSITSDIATVEVTPGTNITTQPTATQSLCIGGTIDIPLSIAYSGGTGMPTYQWYSNITNSTTSGTLIPGAVNSSYTPPVFTTAGTFYYYVVVTPSGSGCGPATSDTAEIIIVNDPAVTTQPLVSQTLCQGAVPTDLIVAATGGIGTYSYQWFSNTVNNTTSGTLIAGATNDIFTPPTATVGTMYYYVQVTQTGIECKVTSTIAEVIINTAPTFTTQPISSTVCEGGTPTILSVAYANGVGNPSYQWYSNTVNSTIGAALIPGATNSTYAPSSATVGITYYFAIINFDSGGGCSSITSDVAMVEITGPVSIVTQPTTTQSLCVGGSIMTPLSVASSGGTGNLSYQWYSNTINSNTGGTLIPGATTATYTPPAFITSGTFYYYAIVTLSGSGCGPATSDTAEIIIVNDPAITTQPLASQTLCQGAIPADLVVVATGGIGTYSYQWYSNTINNTTSGTLITGATNDTFTPPTTTVGTTYYYVQITQTGVGCDVTSANAEVTINPAPTITSQPASSTICLGQVPTVLSVSYTNGVSTPTFQWYSNTVNSTVGATLIPGETNPTYSPPFSSAGTVYYFVVVTFPVGGCSDVTSNIATVTINQNPQISDETAIICSGNTFTIVPDETGGDIVPTGTTYTWSAPVVSPAGTITGASAQALPQTSISQTLVNTTTTPSTVTYTVTPISGVCPGASFTVTVTVNPSVNANAIVTNSTCFGADNGTIQISITGGIPFPTGAPYSIAWTGPNGFTSSATALSNLEPGVYNLTITDQGGCPFSDSYTITEPADIAITTNSETDITCFGDANGAIAISVTGGTGAYTYNWTKDTAPFTVTEDISNLAPGVYEVTVSDANNCGPKTASFTITQPPILTLTLANQTNILCFGASTGAIEVNVGGGTPNYNFAWTGPNGFVSNNQNLANIPAGVYNLTLTDNVGCIQNLTVTITQPTEIIITTTTTEITCFGANNASITVTVTGGNAPYQIGWSNLGTGFFQDNLSAGNYTITITDASGCIKIVTVNIPEAPIFDINPIVTNISCFGANDGSINLNFVGGIAPVTLVWSDGATSGTTRNNLGPGTYTVTITDSKPCVITETFTILEPQPLVLSANITNAFDCNVANSGSINLLVSGGTAPFTYNWSNGATTEDLANIPAGNYQVTVTDARGCSQTASYSINRQPPIVITVDTETVADCEAEDIKQIFEAQVTGGIPPYQLNWSSGTVSGTNNEFMETSQSGTVILNVIDSAGCTSNYTFNVDVPTIGDTSFTLNSFAFTAFGTYSINDPIQFTNTSTGDYESLVWNFGDGILSSEENPTHTYTKEGSYVVTLTVVYSFGCSYVHTITIQVDKGYKMIMPTGFTPNGDSINDIFTPLFLGMKSVEMSVYDTWGEMIYFEKGESIRGWDGKIKGRDAENGNYFFKVIGTTFYGEEVLQDGPFTLIK